MFLDNRDHYWHDDSLLPEVHERDEGYRTSRHLRYELPLVPHGGNRSLVRNHQSGKS